MYKYLGFKAKCSAYYKKAHDGVHITLYDKDGMFCNEFYKAEKACACTRTGEEKELFFEGDGIVKELYELQYKDFKGVCVGEKVLPITEFLYTDIGYHYNGEDYQFVGKSIKDTCECYIVYYANNKKRYVPKSFCTFIPWCEEYE